MSALWKEQLFWFVLAAGVIFGAVVNFLPPVFPALERTFGATVEQLGRSQLFFFAGGIAFSVGGGWVVSRIGLRRAMALSLVLIVLGMAIIATSPVFWGILLGNIVCGAGNMGVVVASSAIITTCFPERRQSVFVIWGMIAAVGASVGPALMGTWLVHAADTGVDWRAAVWFFVGVIALCSLWGWLLRTDRPHADETGTGDEAGSFASAMKIVASPVFVIAAIWMFLHGTAQIGATSWVGELYRARLGINAAKAAYFLSVNALGFFSGRLLLSWITGRWHVPELLVLTLSAVSSGLLFAATILAPGYGPGLFFFWLAGAATSGNAPSILSYYGVTITGHSATAFALLHGVGTLGSAVGPYFVALLGTWFGLETGMWFMPGFMILLGLTAVWKMRRDRRDELRKRLAEGQRRPARP